VLITGGGTGGHVFPGLAVAAALRELGADVHWLGTRQGLEARLVPAAGIPLSTVTVSGIRGKRGWRRLLAPALLAVAVVRAVLLLRRLKPACVLGTGGFVSAPGGLAAWLLRRPLLLHEQNAVAGTANQLLASCATRVLTGFPGVFADHPRRLEVGNPVRREIGALPAPAERYGARRGPLRLLVIGGSQGARALNDAVLGALRQLPAERRPQLWHQCGQADATRCRQAYADAGLDVRLEPFIDDMAAAYTWCDLVLCRAGALTVAEVAAAGVAALFVPLPQAIDDHQRHNALWLVDRQAAELLPQSELDAGQLAARLVAADRDALAVLASAARRCARLDAAAVVARACQEVAGG
jgi:UDP-N-acetylglucosamine--N-acetylmuramyl-(pentapeptide) pyrophosphoryl-undecaprenol N-acetylglucosamine transferase